MWTEFSWAFPESYTADDSWIVRSNDGGTVVLGEEKFWMETRQIIQL